MDASTFVAFVERNAARVTEYKKGGDGSGGKCDCIGLIIGALRMAGHKWPGTHGSNYAARYQTDGLAAGQPLRLGDLVYKARKPGETGYDLPGKYREHPDRNDYYHVGVVTRDKPLEITHCTSVPGGIRRDSRRGKWTYSGRCHGIDRDTEEKKMSYTAKVSTPDGKTVNMRASAKKGAKVLYQVPNGSIVWTEGTEGDFTRCTYEDEALGVLETGYIMSKYLEYIPDGSEDGGSADGGGADVADPDTLTSFRAQLMAIRQAVDMMDGMLDQMLHGSENDGAEVG